MRADAQVDVRRADLEESVRMIVMRESIGDVRPDAIAVQHAADLRCLNGTITASVGSAMICRSSPRTIARR